MIKLYDTVVIKATGQHATVIEINDARGMKAPVYLVEIADEEKSEGSDLMDVVFWCDYSEVEKVN